MKSVLVQNRKIIKAKSDKLPGNFKALLDLITKRTKEFAATGKISGIGFSFPGPLDLKREKILRALNINYLKNKSVKKILAQNLKYPIRVEHDVHCFLLAEKEVGLAKHLKNVFYLTLGSGIGGAFMINGRIIKGTHGAAGEVGHEIIDILKKRDFEVLGSNKFVKSATGKGSAEVLRMANAGDKKSKQTLKELGYNLGIGLANIINTFDPDAVIISGGMSGAKKFIEPGIKSGIKKFVISPEAQKAKVLFSKLGYYAGALGAALLFEK